MTDITRLIKLNVELEGALKVLADRESDVARDIVKEKFAEYSQLMNEFIESAPVEEPIEEPSAEPAEEPVEEPVEERIEEPAVELIEESVTEPETRRPNTVLKSFTLNDKFRFIRDVFAGNEADFNDTINLIAGMDSYAEATDYVYNDMMLDADDPAVAEFMELISRNM